jgi:hypothetical protein
MCTKHQIKGNRVERKSVMDAVEWRDVEVPSLFLFFIGGTAAIQVGPSPFLPFAFCGNSNGTAYLHLFINGVC